MAQRLPELRAVKGRHRAYSYFGETTGPRHKEYLTDYEVVTDPDELEEEGKKYQHLFPAAKVRYRSPEQLRHTFASTMLSRNAPLLYVQQQGGWRSASVLLRVYARWMPQEASLGAHGQPSATQPQPEGATSPISRPVSAR
jgi:integrase